MTQQNAQDLPLLATVADGLNRLFGTHGERFVTLMRHGTLEVQLYAPRGTDPQKPHRRDELYIVAVGNGVFVRGDERVRFGPGDALFVPAGMAHRFEDFSDDFVTWVIFYGPDGGEEA